MNFWSGLAQTCTRCMISHKSSGSNNRSAPTRLTMYANLADVTSVSPAVQFRESLHMGNSNLTQAEIHQLVQKLGGAYKGNSYHLLQRNCNHFANDLCRQLVGKTAPRWVSESRGPRFKDCRSSCAILRAIVLSRAREGCSKAAVFWVMVQSCCTTNLHCQGTV